MSSGLAWHGRWLVLLFAVSFGFANLFPLWAATSGLLGQGVAGVLPPVVLAGLLLALLAWACRRRSRVNIRPVPLVVGSVIALACLGVTDAAFPAKRIHVAEYLMAACLVRSYLVHLVGGWWLAGLTAALAALCGIHDEMIQGLLPDRTFGLSDIVVDTGGAVAGALMGQGLVLFGDGPGKQTPSHGDMVKLALVSAALVVGLLALLAPLPFYRDIPPPGWIGLDVLVVFGVALFLYPMLPHVTTLAFR
jgi:hypothetical protein